mmetsp:Transcript_3272/g.7838  ORF Transcript_3272/g.7838 Transcript_3272/m.7838 type:complete len:220 (-) Transcript_3272:59-718(-)|eukprot:CAMPEP_0173441600 /NCGR_PEP_ID=MMETSP1357-20121228/24044_1 /TAXON_ID=77926 /ORGANISM="Hemiselmis rufescens, Strain PCC563" /LENGTH=219 /DNA_ID=CAMNT_0014407191 /DNA_START=84 /DNA_END=743 /DNA_ORIENTATION=+
MKRMFGGKKEEKPAPSLHEATDTTVKRTGVLEDKIKALDKQLVELKGQIKAARPGPAQNRIKQRAMQVLKQKRMYEGQRNQLEGITWNMEQVNFAHENIKTAQHTADALKGSAAALKTSMAGIKIGEIEDNMDELNDLMEDANEINDALGRSYAVEDDIDEAELDDELAALDEQIALETELGDSETPAYLTDTTEPAQPNQPVPAAAEETDEFGLPVSA